MQSNGAPLSYGAQLRASVQSLRADDAQFAQFARGLKAVLQQWTALQLVAQHCDNCATEVLFEDLCAWHQRDGEVFADDMEVYFEEFFDDLRSVRIEDDSMLEVGTLLHNMYCRCCLNDFSLVELYVQTLPIYMQTNPVAHSVNGGTAEDIANDEEDDDAENEFGEGMGEGCEEDAANTANPNRRAPFAHAEQSVVPPAQQQAQRQQPQRKKRKNASVRCKDGWSIVQ